MARALRILGIHGLGDHRRSHWADDWQEAIAAGLPPEQRAALEFVPFRYDHLFERVRISPDEAWRAFRKLVRSGVRRGRRAELVQESTRWFRWYAGYVVAWLEDAEFRRDIGCALRTTLETTQPHVIAAHSLGSLISYDVLFSLQQTAVAVELERLVYVTLGSQLGNPFVSGNLALGGVQPLPVRQWLHLYNPHDDVFTAPLSFSQVDNFEQIETAFNLDSWADHDPVGYLAHPQAIARVWRRLPEILASEAAS